MVSKSEILTCDKCHNDAPGVSLQFGLRHYKKDISDSTFDFPGRTFKRVAICNNCVNKERFSNIKLGLLGLGILTIILILAIYFGKEYENLAQIIGIPLLFFIAMVLKGIVKYIIMTNKTKNRVREELGKEVLSEFAKSFGEGFYYEPLTQ